MAGYYAERLAADRLQRCYALAPPRVEQYLRAELEHVRARIRPGDLVLDLGCGYGRAIRAWAAVARGVVGIDTSGASVVLGRRLLADVPICVLLRMDAANLGFADGTFDLVACIQNGISAFKAPARRLIGEALRVTRPGGRVLFSSYAAEFWPQRLEWFERQAAEGLVGEIDHAATRPGEIVCKDGFRATTFAPDDFRALAAELGRPCSICEVDGSSVFCELIAAHK
jgi:SAM-dependent methyltransferase